MDEFIVDPDIRKARSIPSEFYTGEEYFERARDLIFARTWQYAGRRSEEFRIRPVNLLPDLLDEPLMVINDQTVRCFSNVCTHRGKTIVEEACNADGIQCGYHGRKFDLSGKFVSMPEFEGVADFPGPEDDLTPVAIGSWSGLDFVSLKPRAPFNEFFGEIHCAFDEFPKDGSAEVIEWEYSVRAHWALYCENYLEGFHIPFVHKSLNRKIDFDTYRTRTFRYSSLQSAAAAGGAAGGGGAPEGPFSNGAAAYYYFVFPNLMFNFYPWGCSVNIVEPKSPELTSVRYVQIVSDDSERGSGAGSDLETIEREDQKVVESVQRGILSRFYSRGRYSVKRETGTHHFHRLIAEFMNDGEGI